MLQRFAQVAPEASDVAATPIEGPFSAPALVTRSNLEPVPREPRNARPYLLEFQGQGGIIVWPGSTEHDPMLTLDAALVPPAGAPAAPGQPEAPPVVQSPQAPAGPQEPPAGAGNAAALQIGLLGLGLGALWWLASRR